METAVLCSEKRERSFINIVTAIAHVPIEYYQGISLDVPLRMAARTRLYVARIGFMAQPP